MGKAIEHAKAPSILANHTLQRVDHPSALSSISLLTHVGHAKARENGLLPLDKAIPGGLA
jgi:hypothetical protein